MSRSVVRGVGDAHGARRDGIRHRDVEGAREALVAVRAVQPESHPRRVVLEDGPRSAVEAVGSAVQRGGALVGRELVRLAVEVEAGARDAVAEAADGGAEIAAVADVGACVGVTEHDADRSPVGVRDLEAAHRSAGRQHLEQQALSAQLDGRGRGGAL